MATVDRHTVFHLPSVGICGETPTTVHFAISTYKSVQKQWCRNQAIALTAFATAPFALNLLANHSPYSSVRGASATAVPSATPEVPVPSQQHLNHGPVLRDVTYLHHCR